MLQQRAPLQSNNQEVVLGYCLLRGHVPSRKSTFCPSFLYSRLLFVENHYLMATALFLNWTNLATSEENRGKVTDNETSPFRCDSDQRFLEAMSSGHCPQYDYDQWFVIAIKRKQKQLWLKWLWENNSDLLTWPWSQKLYLGAIFDRQWAVLERAAPEMAARTKSLEPQLASFLQLWHSIGESRKP